MPAPNTLDALWTKLGLDSLPADAGAAEDLRATRSRDWEAETVRAEPVDALPATERLDLPRISITPPAQVAGPAVTDRHDDLAVVGLLGEGGMGRVLLARQQSLGREVAVKVARPDAPPAVVRALVHEARTTGTLEHPGVIPVYALASDAQGLPALVMKRVDGVSWAALLHDDEDRAWPRVARPGEEHLEAHVRILQQVCNAVAYAHRRGVLHRDLKPSNVLIGELGEVYVADWGVAAKKPTGAEGGKPALVGTPVYMAPEMAAGEVSRFDERTDVFLLGATLFEVLAGKPPYGGSDLKAVVGLAFECRAEPMPSAAPPELAAICGKAMARSPGDRYPDVLSLRDALAAWQQHRASTLLTQATWERLDALVRLLRTGSKDRAAISPLLTECRFGFAQALREWPENEQAKEGLRDAVEAAARFEVSQGSLDEAKALLEELSDVPADLVAAVQRLEASAESRRKREERLAHLSKELDPKVAMRQRVFFMVAMMVVAVVVVGSHTASPRLRAALEGLGAYYPVALMGSVTALYFLALWLGRRSLLGTRLNRRVASVVGAAAVGPLVNRLLAVQTGATMPQTLVADMVLTATACAVGGVTLHWGFFGGATVFVLGAAAASAWPAAASPIYGLSAVIALSAVVLSWTYWRSELWVPKE